MFILILTALYVTDTNYTATSLTHYSLTKNNYKWAQDTLPWDATIMFHKPTVSLIQAPTKAPRKQVHP